MEALCQCTKGDDITITPKLGDPKPGYSAPTFANISRMDYNTGKWVRCKAAERRDYDDWYEEFLNHPCLVVRNKDEAADSVKPVEDPYADSPDEKFENYVLERSWPAVNLYPEAWIAVIGKILKGQYTGSLTEEQFNTLEEALNKFKTAPQSVLDAAKSIPDLDPSNL
jgi:hypothetical protein